MISQFPRCKIINDIRYILWWWWFTNFTLLFDKLFIICNERSKKSFYSTFYYDKFFQNFLHWESSHIFSPSFFFLSSNEKYRWNYGSMYGQTPRARRRKISQALSESVDLDASDEGPFILEFRNSGRRRIYSIAETRDTLSACTCHDNKRFVTPINRLNLRPFPDLCINFRFILT